MNTFDFDEAVEHFHVAQGELLKGNPETTSASQTPTGRPCEGGNRWPRPSSGPRRYAAMAR